MAWFLPLLFGTAATGTAAGAGWGAYTFPEETKWLVANVKDFIVDPEVAKALKEKNPDAGLWDAFKKTRETDGLKLKAIFGNEEAAAKLPENQKVKTLEERGEDKATEFLDKKTNGLFSKAADAMSGGGSKEGGGIINWALKGLMNTDGGFNFGVPLGIATALGGVAALSSATFGTDFINPKLAIGVALAAFAVVNWDEGMEYIDKLIPSSTREQIEEIVVQDRIEPDEFTFD